jgi:hypothetical protein
MANVVKIPYSNTSGNTPSSLANGQIAINQSSGSIFYRNAAGSVTLFAPSASVADGSITTAKLADPLVYDCGVYAAVPFTALNSAWTAIGFTGSGTAASPYTRTGYTGNIVPAQTTIGVAGTVRITGSMYSDLNVVVYKNGTAAYTISDAYGGGGGIYTMNATISVAVNDVIRFGVSGTDFFSLFSGSNLTMNVWWQ